MDIRRIIAVALASLAAALPAQATSVAGPQMLDGRESTRQFQQRTVSTEAELHMDGSAGPGARAYLSIIINHTISGDLPDEQARCGAINGIIALALPPGIEFDAEPRLFFRDPLTGGEQFMYSNAIEQKPWLPDISRPLADASSTSPEQIYRGITELNRVLDKRVTTVLPADPRLLGRDPGYSVAGKSWIVPCNVMFTNLTDLFEPEQSLVKAASLGLRVPVRFTGDYVGEEIVVYAGFLSTAVARVTMLPSEIPPDAIILVEQQEQQEPAVQDAEPADGSAQNDAETADAPAEPQQEDATAQAAPAETSAEQTAEPAEPEPVDALIYSFEWVSWETTSTLEPASPGQPGVDEILASDDNQEGAGQPEYVQPPGIATGSGEGEAVAVGTPVQPEPAIAAVPRQESGQMEGGATPAPKDQGGQALQEEGESIDVLAPGGTRPADPPVANVEADLPAAETESGQAEAAEAGGTTLSQPPAQTADGDRPGVVEIEPGTLPAEEEYYVVPLKPITGSGRGPAGAGSPVTPPGMPGTAPGMPHQAPGIAAGQFVPPSDLGEMVLVPEGYFLMGTANTASAGDADELPQGQVYLPAYYIDKHLVTNRQFYAFVVSSGFKPQGSWDKYYDQGTADMPVRGVTWDDANAYARWAGKRLPTEAEWEKAARGTDGRLYPWGDNWTAEILPRGDFVFNLVHAPNALSPFGLQSMVGVLWQWTASSYAPYPYNPDARQDEKVLRGGCYSNGRNIVRCANRYAEPFNVALNTFGFRCARDA